MSEYNLDDIIDLTAQQSPTKVQDAVNHILGQKSVEALESMKSQLAQSLYGDPEEEEQEDEDDIDFDDEDEELDDDDLDDDDLDIEDEDWDDIELDDLEDIDLDVDLEGLEDDGQDA